MVTDNKVPHVIAALGKILKDIGVEKKGILPSNMGGSPYIRANDLFSAVRDANNEQGLILLPSETVTNHRHEAGQTHVVIRGEYTFYSTKDGSSVTISGTGDGLARNTAIASNVASTNAEKNALMRLILTGESGTDEQAKREVGNENTNHPPQQPSHPARRATRGTDNFRDRVKEEYLDTGLKTKEQVNALWNEFGRDFKKVYAHLESEG